MSNSKKTHELIRQNEQIVKKSQKHDANLRKNSTLYFQVGLIICLLFTYGLFEMTFETDIPEISKRIEIVEPFSIEIPIIKPVEPTFDEPIEKKRVKDPSDYIEVPNETPDEIFKKDPTETVPSEPDFDPNSIPPLEKKPEDDVDIPFTSIEQVPVYPGCENKKTNDAKRKCMSDKITKLVQRKFDTELANELGLSGKQVIRTQFKIDNTGKVVDIKTRGTHPDLEKEAERVINIIPEMTPGKQRDINVGVIYSLPIVFQVQ
ncbi:energy transducer TonB [Algibacter aquimarinus]|uniref:TonB C-terminal domain-containing protein n=1 Tax=Algibacter aquimarinus TaxID=1136748 RepID=A0ABP9HJ35_9FLAO